MKKMTLAATLVLMSPMMSGCAGMLISETTDAALAVAKVPFKVAGAVVDVVDGDDDD